jgi:hypothetical protein
MELDSVNRSYVSLQSCPLTATRKSATDLAILSSHHVQVAARPRRRKMRINIGRSKELFHLTDEPPWMRLEVASSCEDGRRKVEE